jgi:hypothetical protein
MTAFLDENKLREKLISLYERYLENPQDWKNLSIMDKIEQDYSLAYDLIKSEVINHAVNLAGSIEEKEVSGSNTFLDNKDSIVEAKKMLESLKSE